MTTNSVIPESLVRSRRERHYDVQGVAGHTHTLVLMSAHVEALLAGKRLDLTTGRGAAHFHYVYLSYPA